VAHAGCLRQPRDQGSKALGLLSSENTQTKQQYRKHQVLILQRYNDVHYPFKKEQRAEVLSLHRVDPDPELRYNDNPTLAQC
jgi:hypothetical protein